MTFEKHIYLIGFMGAGKSTVAKALSKRTGLPVVEMDEELVRRAGMSINEIFAAKGEGTFRQMESALLSETAAGGPAIVSCGGGLVKDENNVKTMRQSGTVIFLTATPETILSRVLGDHSRPLLEGKHDIVSIAEMIAERAPLYERAADQKTPVDGKTPDAIADEILVDLKEENC